MKKKYLYYFNYWGDDIDLSAVVIAESRKAARQQLDRYAGSELWDEAEITTLGPSKVIRSNMVLALERIEQ